jgi:hypothetical protein
MLDCQLKVLNLDARIGGIEMVVLIVRITLQSRLEALKCLSEVFEEVVGVSHVEIGGFGFILLACASGDLKAHLVLLDGFTEALLEGKRITEVEEVLNSHLRL